jgi:glutamate synthase domain-containing protein 2
MRKTFILSSITAVVLVLVWSYYWTYGLLAFVVIAPLIYMGVADMVQKQQSIRRNFPIMGRLRYVFEDLRPKIQQYFVESDTDGAPINRNDRSVIYQRAKKQIDTTPFGTQHNVYAEGYEWMSHSIVPLDFHTIDHPPHRPLLFLQPAGRNPYPQRDGRSGACACNSWLILHDH